MGANRAEAVDNLRAFGRELGPGLGFRFVSSRLDDARRARLERIELIESAFARRGLLGARCV